MSDWAAHARPNPTPSPPPTPPFTSGEWNDGCDRGHVVGWEGWEMGGAQEKGEGVVGARWVVWGGGRGCKMDCVGKVGGLGVI